MPHWRLSVDLADLWAGPGLPIARRDEIAARLRASRWPQITTDCRRLAHLLDGFAAADPDPSPEVWWQGLYDLADRDRV